jgi:hypothetical protein
MVTSYAENVVFQRNFLEEPPEKVLINGRDYFGFSAAVAIVTRLVWTFKVNVKAIMLWQCIQQHFDPDFAVFLQVA